MKNLVAIDYSTRGRAVIYQGGSTLLSLHQSVTLPTKRVVIRLANKTGKVKV